MIIIHVGANNTWKERFDKITKHSMALEKEFTREQHKDPFGAKVQVKKGEV